MKVFKSLNTVKALVVSLQSELTTSLKNNCVQYFEKTSSKILVAEVI